VEIYQNCNIFNDGAWDPLKDADTRDDLLIRLEHGKPIRVGTDRAVFHDGKGSFVLDTVTPANEHDIVVHDAGADDPSLAFALSRMSDPVKLTNTPIGVFRDVQRDVFDRGIQHQIDAVTAKQGVGDLDALLRSADTWEIK